MSNKLTDEELQVIKDIRQEYANLAMAFGELELQKFNIIEAQKELVDKETKLVKKLKEKYGEGTIDLSTGEIKP